MTLTGTLVGYDPGGNGAHGLAIATYQDGEVIELELSTCRTAEKAIAAICVHENVLGIGIDTLTCWSTGPSGWRPADRWLKNNYPSITNSIASANSLFGSMGLNGMAVLLKLRQTFPGIHVSETHPKVLYFELAQSKYDYGTNSAEMDALLGELLGMRINTGNDHEWDAAVSVYALSCGLKGRWAHDLHRLATQQDESIVEPAGTTSYWWPK